MNELVKFGLPADIKLISVVGIGSFGTGAVNYMKENGLTGIDYFQLNSNQASDDIAQTMENIENQWFNKLVFIVLDANEVSERELFQKIGARVKELDRINIGLLTIPFSINNTEIKKHTHESLNLLKNCVDQILVILTGNILHFPCKISEEEMALNIYCQAMIIVKTIQQALSCRSAISIDFWDIRSLSFKGGYGIVFKANTSGENRYVNALEMALDSLKNSKILKEDQSFLLYLTYGSEEVTVGEIQDLMDCFINKVSPSADILWSTGYDPELREIVQVTIIVAGLEIDSIEI